MNSEKWDLLDRASRRIFKDFLVKLGFTDLIESQTGRQISWDIRATYKNTRVGFELKERAEPFGTYPDMIVERHKLDVNGAMIGVPDEPEFGTIGFDKFKVVSIYPESRIIAIADLMDDKLYESENLCNNATLVDDWSHDKRVKNLVHYPYKAKFSYDYTENGIKIEKIKK